MSAWMPHPAPGTPYDLDGGERITRPKTGIDVFPNVPMIGMVSGFLRQFDPFVWAQMYGKNPFGPGVGSVPVNLQWQITVPGLTKYTETP